MVRFPKFGDSRKMMYLSSKQVDELLEDEALMFSMFALLQVNRETTSMELPVVCEFPKVFQMT